MLDKERGITMRISRRASALITLGGASVVALSSVAWACTAHFGTISVCATPNAANLNAAAKTGAGAGCTTNVGDGGMESPGYPYRSDSLGATTPVRAQPGADLRIAMQTWSNNSYYSINFSPNPVHGNCHSSGAEIWYGQTDKVGNVFTGAKSVTYTIPTATTYRGVAWVCYQENFGTRTTGVAGYRSPYNLPDPGGVRGDFGVLTNNGAMGMAVPLSII